MRNRGLRGVAALLLVLGTARLEAADPVEYLRDVKPILASNCYACHGAKVQMMGLRLDTAAAMLGARTRDRIVVPGNSAASRIIQAVSGAEGVTRMPLQKPPLTAEGMDRPGSEGARFRGGRLRQRRPYALVVCAAKAAGGSRSQEPEVGAK